MRSKIRVKICGITNKQDMDAIIKYDAYYAGLMFFEKSPRFVETELARQLSLHAGNKIGAMVELKLHGEETPERVKEIKLKYQLPVIKAIGISEAKDLKLVSIFSEVSDQLLIDAKPPKSSILPGGNGLSFDWSLIKNIEFDCPWLLAGGLNSKNAANAIDLTGATQLDLSSGVEKSPGVKDENKIASFMSSI